VVFTSAGHDDSHITYWAARSLLELGEIVNYNGDRVEQSSSLLHVLLTAGLAGATRLPVPTSGFLLGLAGAAATTVLAYAAAWRLRGAAGPLAGVVVALLPFLAYWSVGGLETTLASATLLAAVLAAWAYAARGGRRRRFLALATVTIAAFVLVRPEAGLVLTASFVVAGVLWWLLTRLERVPLDEGLSLLRLGHLVVLTLGCLAAVTAWRLAYFGEAMPNPVGAKVGGLAIGEGLRYVARTLDGPDVVVVLAGGALAILAALRRPHPLRVLLGATAVVQLGAVVAAGGDWMGGGRMLVPALPLLAVLAADAVMGLPRPGTRRVLAAGLVASQVLGLAVFARSDSLGKPLWASVTWDDEPSGDAVGSGWFERNKRVHRRDLVLVPELVRVVDQLDAHVDGPVTVASGQAGLITYRLMERRYGEVRFIDRLSLVTDEFGACRDAFDETPFGLDIPYDHWFDHTTDCGVDVPDVVFDLGRLADRPDLQEDFVSVFEVTGSVGSGSDLLPGAALVADESILVRKDLAQHIAGR
jgi:hypothetical protein